MPLPLSLIVALAKDRAIAKFHRRAVRWTAAPALVMTLVEAVLTLIFVRFVFRMVMWAVYKVTGKGGRGLPSSGALDPH